MNTVMNASKPMFLTNFRAVLIIDFVVFTMLNQTRLNVNFLSMIKKIYYSLYRRLLILNFAFLYGLFYIYNLWVCYNWMKHRKLTKNGCSIKLLKSNFIKNAVKFLIRKLREILKNCCIIHPRRVRS